MKLKKIGVILIAGLLMMAMSVSVIAIGNCIANQATITASSEYNDDYAAALAVHENEAEHDQGTEWASAGELDPWVRFEWADPVWIGRIILADRNNLADFSKGIEITFSDGSSLTMELEDDGPPVTADFDAKNVTWVQMNVVDWDDRASANNGLGRISIYETDAPPAPAEPEPDAPAAIEEPAATPQATATPAPAPVTADPITLFAIGSLVSAAGIIIAKKRK
jgi:hypothetical protein